MQFWKRVRKKISEPPAWVGLLTYATAFSAFALAVLAIVMGKGVSGVAFTIYAVTLLSTAYAVYITVLFFRGLGVRFTRVTDRYPFFRKLRRNYRFRALLSSVGSFLANVAYTVFLCFTALYTRSLWYWVVATYYILVVSVRGGIFVEARNQRKKYGNDGAKLKGEEIRLYANCGKTLFVLTFVLVGAVAQTVFAGSRFPVPNGIFAVFAVFAVVTVYRVGLACYHYFKAKRSGDLVIRAVRNINFTTALVSILTLQTLAFDAFAASETTASVWNGVTGFTVCALMATVGVSMLVRASKTRNGGGRYELNLENTAFQDGVIIKNNAEKGVNTMKKYCVGIDLGGTFIKGGIVDENGGIVVQDKTPTESEKGADGVAENIARLAETLLTTAGIDKSEVEGIGMGVPGMIDSKEGVVIYSNNLNWKDFAIGARVEALTGLKTKIANDANVAALGEARFGAAKGRKNVIMLTLGTGVGGGIVADGKLVEGNKSAGAELGHSVIVAGGELCTCGRKGCLEAYASATALIRDTKRAMEAHKDSKMWEIGALDAVTGKTAFDYRDSDPYAKEVVDNYIYNLACGITNFANIFRPEVVLLGGGVCAQGDNLVKPLQKLLNEELFAGELGPQVEIRIAELGNSAGLLGAAALLS